MRVLIFAYIFLSVILNGCGGLIYIPPKYNPEKAGATIVESYNISGQLNTTLQDGVYHDGYSDMAIYSDNIYILADEVINIFQKDDFKKLNEIEISILNKPDDEARIEYDDIVVVNEKKGFISCSLRYIEEDNYSYTYSLVSVNLTTGDAELLNMRKSAEERIEEMGYDKIYDYIWFRSFGLDGDVWFYTYDFLNKNFLFSKKIRHIANSEDISFNAYRLFINGDEWFYTGYLLGHWRPKYVTAVKYNVNRPGEKIYSINPEYLEIDGGAGNILYDEPYIWMLVKKDNKLQMLKLLPNEE